MLINPDKLFKTKPEIAPQALMPWLMQQTSLMQQLKRLAGDAQLIVLKQQWQSPSWWDKYALGLEPQVNKLFQREVLISAHNRPCWYARTLIPEHSFQKKLAFFTRLQEKSLGELIFNEPSVARLQHLHYAIDKHCLEYYWLPEALVKADMLFWVRVAVFTLDNLPFYLIEILLPELLSIKP